MPNCVKCGEHYSSRITINGKRLVLTKRSKCYKCFPYKARAASSNDEIGDNRTCVDCGQTFKKRKDYSNRCKVCKTLRPRLKRKLEIVAYKGGRCQKCGYDKCLRALSFHHLNKDDKKYNISQVWYNLEQMKDEADKCVLLCANCHMELHDNIWNIEQLPNAEKITCTTS